MHEKKQKYCSMKGTKTENANYNKKFEMNILKWCDI